MEVFTFPEEIFGRSYSSGFSSRIPKGIGFVSRDTLFYRIELNERSFQMVCNIETKEVKIIRDYLHDEIDVNGGIKVIPVKAINCVWDGATYKDGPLGFGKLYNH